MSNIKITKSTVFNFINQYKNGKYIYNNSNTNSTIQQDYIHTIITKYVSTFYRYDMSNHDYTNELMNQITYEISQNINQIDSNRTDYNCVYILLYYISTQTLHGQYKMINMLYDELSIPEMDTQVIELLNNCINFYNILKKIHNVLIIFQRNFAFKKMKPKYGNTYKYCGKFNICNTNDLLLADFSSYKEYNRKNQRYVLSIKHENTLFRFSLDDVVSLYKTNLFYSEDMIVCPKHICNPYNRIYLSKIQEYMCFIFIKLNKNILPIWLHTYVYRCNFDIFEFKYTCYKNLMENTTKDYVMNIMNENDIQYIYNNILIYDAIIILATKAFEYNYSRYCTIDIKMFLTRFSKNKTVQEIVSNIILYQNYRMDNNYLCEYYEKIVKQNIEYLYQTFDIYNISYLTNNIFHIL